MIARPLWFPTIPFQAATSTPDAGPAELAAAYPTPVRLAWFLVGVLAVLTVGRLVVITIRSADARAITDRLDEAGFTVSPDPGRDLQGGISIDGPPRQR